MRVVSTYGRVVRVLVCASWATLVGQVVVSCSSNSDMPPDLGGCVKVGDASCPTPDPGGGGGSGPGGGGDGGSTDTGTVVSGCGTGQNLLGTANQACPECVVGTAETGTDCCQADTICSQQSDCLGLISCMVACGNSNTTCQDGCESTYSSGVSAYDDFAGCLATNCSPECPTLPTGGTDF